MSQDFQLLIDELIPDPLKKKKKQVLKKIELFGLLLREGTGEDGQQSWIFRFKIWVLSSAKGKAEI